jgi:hypothetical protein
MDVSNIASLATNMAQTRIDQEVGIAVLKKALDAESSLAAGLIAAIPTTPSANLPPHLGQNINTSA